MLKVQPAQLPRFTLVCIVSGLNMRATKIIESLSILGTQTHLISAPEAASSYLDLHHDYVSMESLYVQAVARTIVGLGPLMGSMHVNAVISDFPACPEKCRELFEKFPSARCVLHILDSVEHQSLGHKMIHLAKELVRHRNCHELEVVVAA